MDWPHDKHAWLSAAKSNFVHLPLLYFRQTAQGIQQGDPEKVHEGAVVYKDNPHHAVDTKCSLQKQGEKRLKPHQQTLPHPCPHCSKIYRSRIGLFAHLQKNQENQLEDSHICLWVTADDDKY